MEISKKTGTLRLNSVAKFHRQGWGVLHASHAVNCAAVLLGLLLGASGARAGTINYVFSNDASTILNGDSYSISGGFTYNATTEDESLLSIVLTGSGPLAGDYTEVTTFPASPGQTAIAGFQSPDTIHVVIQFANNLGNGMDDPLTEVIYSPSGYTDTAPTGEALAAPEPSSGILLLTGVAMMAFLSRRRLLAV